MVNVDSVVRDLKIEKKAQFDMIDLYKTMKSWFDLHEYKFAEKQYQEEVKGDKKSISIVWDGEKDVNEYTRFKLAVSISLKNYEFIETKKGKIVEGSLVIKFGAVVRSDYENRWEKSPVMVFFRGIFDKFIASNKKERYEKELKEDAYDIFHRTKAYLNLHKFR
jgi:hypothetical protein